MSYKLSKDDISIWLQRIKASEEWRKPYERKWDRYLGYLKNQFFKIEDSDDRICVNLVHPHIRVIIPATYARNPDVMVRTRLIEYGMIAEAVENVLKYFFIQLKVKEELKLILFDAILYGHGWIKGGYQTEFEQIETDPTKPIITQMLDTLKQAVLGKELTPEQEYALARDAKILEESPWLLRVSVRDMFVPALTRGGPGTVPWIAERIILPHTDVKNNPNYRNLKNLKPSTNIDDLLRLNDGSKFFKMGISDDDLEYNVLYEIYDVRSDRIYTIADGHDQELDCKDNEYSFLDNRHPYEMLAFNRVSDEFYPMSDIDPWEPQLLELNKTRTQQIKHRKRFNRKYVYKSSAFKEDDIDKLKTGEDGALIPTDDDNVQTAILPLQDAPLPPETYAVESRIKSDIDEIGGISSYQRGTTSTGAKTATEASIVDSNSRFRSDERLDEMTTFVKNIARNLALICLKYVDQQEAARIIGDKAKFWINLEDDDELRRELMFDIEVGSTAPVNREVERQQYMEFYSIISNDPAFDLVKPRLELMKKFGIKDPEQWIANQLIPVLMEKRMAEAMMPPDGAPELGTETESGDQGGGAIGPGTPLDQAATDGAPSMGSIKSGLTRRMGVNTGVNGKETPGYA